MQKRFLGILTTLLTLIFASYAQAATITPTTFDDFFDGMNCSLRNAVQSMNAGVPVGNCVNTGDAFGTNDTIALQAGTYTLSIPGNNEDDNETGDLDVFPTTDPITITGAGSDQTIIDASAISDRAIDFIEVVENATISGVQITGGDVSALGQDGGAIRAATLVLNLEDVYLLSNFAGAGGGLAVTCETNIINSVFELNQAQTAGGLAGGGIFLSGPDFCGDFDTMTIENSQIIDNRAEEIGGGIAAGGPVGVQINNSTVDGNMANFCGGGIYAEDSVVAISYSTISRNEIATGAGGGICDGSEYLFLTNSTVSTNTVQGGDGGPGAGGGIYSGGGLKGMYNVTVAFNQVNGAGGGGGGVIRFPPFAPDDRFQTQVFNTIIANNTAELGPDCFGEFDSGGNNLIGNIGAAVECVDSSAAPAFTAPGDQAGTPGSPIDPQLGPLQLNGGTTETHALALSSPAVDMGNNVTGCQALDTALFFDTDTLQFNTLTDDQRFLTRPVGILDPNNPICDIGAFELQALSFMVTKDDGLGGSSVEVNDNFTYTIVLTNNGPDENATNVTLSDPLPPQVSFVSVNTTQGTCGEAAGVVTCDIGDIPVGGSVTVTITVLAEATGEALNTVTVTASLEEYTASVITPIVTAFLEGSGCRLNPNATFSGYSVVSLLALLAGVFFLRRRRLLS